MDESQRHPSGELADDSPAAAVKGDSTAAGQRDSTAAGQRDSTAPATQPDPDELQPLSLSSATVTLWGTVAWLVALGVILAVPALHEGDRHWWPWTCVAAIGLGLFGFSYVRRGRGNAAGAD